jgi:PAS domain S-box-containing protein
MIPRAALTGARHTALPMTDIDQSRADTSVAALCRGIVESASEAIIFADRDGHIRLWNRGAERVFGHAAEEVLGQRLDVIIPEHLRRAHWDAYDRSVATGCTKHTDRVLTTRSMHKNGSKLYVDLSFGLVKDANGFVLGAFAVGRDCTARYLAGRATKMRLDELEAKLAGAGRPT